MRIGTKIAFSQLAMGALIVAAMYVAAYWVWAPEYVRWEVRQTADKEKWTQRLWEAEEKRLALTVADWAPWDELYDFAQRPAERKFERDNLSDDAMLNLRVDWVMILDPAYKIRYSRSLLRDWEEKELLRLYHLLLRSSPGPIGQSDTEEIQPMTRHTLRYYPHTLQVHT